MGEQLYYSKNIQKTLIIYWDEHIMLLNFPIILSSNSFFLHLLFTKLFPEMKQLNIFFVPNFCIRRYSTLIEQSPELHLGTVFVRLIIETWFHDLKVNCLAIH